MTGTRRIGAVAWLLALAFVMAGGAWFFLHRADDSAGRDTEVVQRGRPDESRAAGGGSPAGTTRADVANPAPTISSESSLAAVIAFEDWLSTYLATPDASARAGLLKEGERLAAARREALYALMASNPKFALEAAVPWVDRAALPLSVRAHLEERVSGIGAFNAVAALPPEGEAPESFRAVYREAIVNDRTFEAFVYGRRTQLMTNRAIALHGIAIDGRLAVADSPVRVMDPGEPIPPGKRVDEICLVSGEPAGPDDIAPGQPVIAADLGDRVVYLCHAEHISLIENGLVAQESGDSTVAGPTPAAPPEYTTGTKSVLLIRVRFADQAASYEPQSEIDAQAMLAETGAFLHENSYGALTIIPTITPVYVLPESAAWYQQNDSSGYGLNVLQAARAVAANPAQVAGNEGRAAFDYANFDFEVVRYSGGPGGFSGQGYVGLRGCWLKTSSAGVLAHELGHNLGLWHANGWVPTLPDTVVGAGTNIEYGDVFDSMGPAVGGAHHFNTYEKNRLNWLPSSAVQTTTASGVYEVHAHDIASSVDSAKKMALFVPRDADRDYWFEFRRHPGWDENPWLANGLGVRWDPWLSGNGGSQLLDATPGSPDGRSDGTILIGHTFSDPVADIHVTPLGFVSGGNSALQVDVEIGPFPGNHAPVVVLDASAMTAAVGQTVAFSAAASDADGDALAYFWDFGDRSLGANTSAISKSWGQPGDYRVRLVVSDRKGGTASTSTVVRVGEPSGGMLSGRVVDLDDVPVPDVHVDNGRDPIDPDYRDAWTNSDGSFVLTGLPAGSWTLQASRGGWAIAPLAFGNPVATPRADESVDFLARFVGYTISGVVQYADGTPVAHALVSNGVVTEPTDENGSYRLVGQAPGTYALTATKGDAVFEAESVIVSFENVVAPTIREATHTVTGTVTGAEGGWVTISDGWRSTSVSAAGGESNAEVAFELDGVPAGSWHLWATQANASFAPSGWANPLAVANDVANVNFARGEAMTYAISGRVTDLGEGVADASVTAGDATTTTDSRGRYHLSGLAPGSYLATASAPGLSFAPVGHAITISNGDAGASDFASTRINLPPVITAAAYAIPPFDRSSIALAIEADDDGGSEFLRYEWSVVNEAPGSVTFSRHGTHSAAETVATFSRSGEYHLRATVTDGHGASVFSTVALTVQPVPVAIAIQPDPVLVPFGSNLRFTLIGTDQFGAPVTITSGADWSVSGGGTIAADGTLQATVPGEDFEVVARVQGRTARAAFAVGYAPGPGTGLTQEVWTQLPGNRVTDLRNWPAFPDQPDQVSVLSAPLEITAASGGGAGRRFRGYFVPPVSGDYVFQIAAADAAELWLSPGVVTEQAQRIAWVDQPVAFRDWDRAASQQSAAVPLMAGQSVYLEVLHKNSSAGGHLSVGVQAPGGVLERPIPSHRLMPWGSAAFAPPEIVVPARATPARVAPGQSTALAVAASSPTGGEALRFKWTVTGSAPGAVLFSANNSNAAQATTAQLGTPGRYQLRVTVTDVAGQTARSDVQVVVTESIAAWRARFFSKTELADASKKDSRWGDEADPDGDGLNNLIEYAFGLDPLTPGNDGMPRPTVVTVAGIDYLAITFRRNVAATGITFTPQASSDLKNWQTGLQPVESADGETLTYRDFVPLQDTRRRFVRVQVESN